MDEFVTLTRADTFTRHVSIEINVRRDPASGARRQDSQQVLLNLLLNRMDVLAKVADDERSLTLPARTAGGSFAEVAVGDNGHGVSADKLGRLF